MNSVLSRPLAEVLSERYLSYALSTIMSRSLPDVRDGLKPVHRRLIYAMRELKLNPEAGFKKCARIVGDVMGKYHPHGDLAIYEAMVRMAQSFSLRYPLVDGQGNFGTVDGDNAAAMRYTEARMTITGMALLEGIDEECVDFRSTYDSEGEEPVILPAAFPNLLANGSSGIAVGMATNIPPHNILELCDAALALIKNPQLSDVTLAQIVKGPDFPTGGILAQDQKAFEKAYMTGKGYFRLRARWHVEELGGSSEKIIITEIPWQTQKLQMVEKIALMIHQRKLPALQAIYDESAEDVRVVLELRRGENDAETIMESLFRAGEGESKITLNMNVLDRENIPRVMSLGDVLRAWLAHRHEILLRRKKFRLKGIEKRIEVLEGYLICYRFMDKVIAIVRESDYPREQLMSILNLTERQAQAILDMRLRQLRRLEEKDIQSEHQNLLKEKETLLVLLNNPQKRDQAIGDDISALKECYIKNKLGKRRTEIKIFQDIKMSAHHLAAREPITVFCSEKGWIRRVKNHDGQHENLRYKEGDGPLFDCRAMSSDPILAFCSNGRSYGFSAEKLPSNRGFGEPITLFANIPGHHKILTLFAFSPKRRWLLISNRGFGFIVHEKNLLTRMTAGKTIFTLREQEEVQHCLEVKEQDHLALLSNERRLVVFPLDEVGDLARGRGVMLQKYHSEKEILADAMLFSWNHPASWRGGSLKKEKYLTHRARRGALLPPRVLPRNHFLSPAM